MFLPVRRKDSDVRENYYERRGNRVTHKIASAVAKRSWKWTLLNLAWTVGPVTFIALQGGHYLGFGNQAPFQNFIYFAGYTFIAALLAGTATILYDVFQKPKVEQEQQHLIDTVETAYLTILHIRNLMLQQLDENERKIAAAYYVLEGTGISPSAIETAVMDLTGNKDLTRAARRVYVFAEQGMDSRIADIEEDISSMMLQVKKELYPIAPSAYERLEQHMKGAFPRAQTGIERSEGFIERVLYAAEENDEDLMTLDDAYQMLTLAFEFMTGRRIAVLDVRLKGHNAFEEAQVGFDEARHHYRMALRRRNSYIRLLVTQLYHEAEVEIVVDAVDSSARMIQAMTEGLKSIPAVKRNRYKADYEKIVQLNKRVKMRYDRLLKAQSTYAKSWQKHGQKITFAIESDDIASSGFYFEERFITLTDRQKLHLAHMISQSLSDPAHEQTESDIKKAIMDIANELDDLIDMSQPEEQLAIESSNAANFGFITTGITPLTKAGWSSIAVQHVQENRRKASHRVARNLVRLYRVPLKRSMIERMVEHFGADEEYLTSLSEEAQTDKSVAEAMPTEPYSLPEWSQLK